jgi:hypothetical protein
MAKPTVPEAIAAMDELVAASEKLRTFIRFLDAHKKSADARERAINIDLRNMSSRMVVEIEGMMRKTEELAVGDEISAHG